MRSTRQRVRISPSFVFFSPLIKIVLYWIYILQHSTEKNQSNTKKFTKYKPWALHGQISFKRQDYGTFISSHGFTHLHRKVLIITSILSLNWAGMDPIETLNCGKQQYANTHGLTIDGAISFTTVLPLMHCEAFFHWILSHIQVTQVQLYIMYL